jgi:hypothetical protein
LEVRFFREVFGTNAYFFGNFYLIGYTGCKKGDFISSTGFLKLG